MGGGGAQAKLVSSSQAFCPGLEQKEHCPLSHQVRMYGGPQLCQADGCCCDEII